MATFVLRQSPADRLFYWYLKSDNNGEKVCWAEGYSSKQNAQDSIAFVRKYASGADYKEE